MAFLCTNYARALRLVRRRKRCGFIFEEEEVKKKIKKARRLTFPGCSGKMGASGRGGN
jgi:hypothetical protein